MFALGAFDVGTLSDRRRGEDRNAVSSVLPQRPMAPWRVFRGCDDSLRSTTNSWLGPALGWHVTWAKQDLPKAIFATVKTGVAAGALADSLDEGYS